MDQKKKKKNHSLDEIIALLENMECGFGQITTGNYRFRLKLEVVGEWVKVQDIRMNLGD